jgi:hypothetical protein
MERVAGLEVNGLPPNALVLEAVPDPATIQQTMMETTQLYHCKCPAITSACQYHIAVLLRFFVVVVVVVVVVCDDQKRHIPCSIHHHTAP